MEKTYLFYDLETTGLKCAFDQIVQFSAIRTNEELTPLEEFNFTIKLRPDIIPSPAAQITHCISIKKLLAYGKCEYEAAKDIHSIINMPGTTSLGYNTMQFDSEMLRFMFHRNLLDPYSHQYKNGCSQMDVLPMLLFCHLYRPELLKWPTANGKVSFRLEDIANENGFWKNGDKAHDALSDTRAVIEIVKKISSDKALFRYLSDFFNCGVDAGRLNSFPVILNSEINGMSQISHRLGLHLSQRYVDGNFQASALCLGNSIAYPKQSLWLVVDDPDFQTMTINNFADKARVVRKKNGGNTFIVPGNEKFCKLPPEKISLAKNNLAWINDHISLFESIVRYFREYQYPCPSKDMDADALLYGGPFVSDKELMYFQRFHDAENSEKKLNIKFPRPIHNELAKRIVWRNYAESKDSAMLNSYTSFIKSLIKDSPVYDHNGRQRLTPKEALVQIGVVPMERDLNDDQKRILEELDNYIKNMFLFNSSQTGKDIDESFCNLKNKYFNIVTRLMSAVSQAKLISNTA